MNVELDNAQLQAFDHLNRAQQRAFILRDQLKYTDPRYLDMFINGIANPEPPLYKAINGTVQPPLKAVTIKEEAKSFDLGNVEFKNKQVKRIILNVVNDEYNIDADEPLPPDPRNIQTVPINYLVAQNTFPQVKAKYEAIHDRVQAINQLRKHMFDEARRKPEKPLTRFKDGKSFTQLMDSIGEAGPQVPDLDFRKRPGEFISRHELNKKKRIGLDHVSDRIKTEAVNGLPDETKIDLFNAFVRSAFPDFDNLLMASWNVVSIYVNVGSENEMLHNSVGDLHEVLMKFDELLGKSKKPRPGVNGRAEPRNEERHSLVRNAPETPEPSNVTYGIALRLNYPMIPNGDNAGMENGVIDSPPKRPTPFRLPSSSRQIERPSSISPGQTASQRVKTPSPSSTIVPSSQARSTGRNLPQTHADLFKKKDPRLDMPSVIDQGYAHAQKQKQKQAQQTPPSSHTVEAATPKPSNAIRSSPPSSSSSSSQLPSQAPATQSQRYGMFHEPVRGATPSTKDLDSLFVEDDEEDDEEAVQTPAMQEIHEQEEAKTSSPAQKPLAMGNSLLGRSLKERMGAGGAPVAPMVHTGSGGKKEGERRAQ